MYLSKLELHGFKSFALRTVLHFDDGITAVVGPNGCGKSNIVDALRWVIGEQRARILRSEKMDNVIFNGTTKRRPLGLSEVQLTIENSRGVLPTEYAEVTIGRRLYRSGDSEYLLNGTPCRLRDIVDLFMDTGMGAGAYSVIELKMIEEILSDNAHERRHLFEEAAGITKYKQRRTQALRKLDSTQVDLNRLRDLTDEIEKRVRSLKRQAAKAERFKKHEARLHQVELMLAQTEFDRLTAQENAIHSEIQSVKDALGEQTARLAKDEATLESYRKTLIDQEKIVAKSQQRLSRHLSTVRDLETNIQLEKERLLTAQRDQERTKREHEASQELRTTAEHRAINLSKEIDSAEPVLIKAQDALQVATNERDQALKTLNQHRDVLQKLRHREHETTKSLTTHRRDLDRLTNRLELLTQEEDRLHNQFQDIDNNAKEHDASFRESETQVKAAQQAVTVAQEALSSAQKERTAKHDQLDSVRLALQKTEREHDALAAEIHLLESLLTSYDEYSNAVQFLASTPRWATTSFQTVADTLVCDEEYQFALETALGSLASCIVVQSDEEAHQAISLLRTEEKGQATFLILDRLPDNAPVNNVEGKDFQSLQDLIRVSESSLAKLIPYLFHNCYFVSSLEEGQLLSQKNGAPARYFTSAGEWVDAQGFIHAGSSIGDKTSTTSRIGRREHLSICKERIAELSKQLESFLLDIDRLQEERDTIPIQARQEILAQAEHDFKSIDREHTRLSLVQKSLNQRRDDLTSRLKHVQQEFETGKGRIAPLNLAVVEVEEQAVALQNERESMDTALREAELDGRLAQERYNEANVAAVEAKNKRDNLSREIERTQQEMQTLANRADELQNYLGSLGQTIETAQTNQDAFQQQLDVIQAQRAELDDAVSQSKTALLYTRTDIDKVEHRLRKLRQSREQQMREENTRAVRQAEIHTRKEDLLANVLENSGISLAETPVSIEEDFEEENGRAEVQEIRRKIKTLGNINALALEEYEQEKERFDFLSTQKADLESAEATLLETIDEINATAATRFFETYEAIRESFRMLFTELFGEDASADLKLTDLNDPLESPIEIMAKPRGKRPISISQLSSGEKTLTAIALLFAIYLVKPSPFCVLDEVDAPLDEANIDRFMHLLRRFSDETQFILITHNKRTMEMADRLYGITMQEQGVSTVVGVKFEEALEIAG